MSHADELYAGLVEAAVIAELRAGNVESVSMLTIRVMCKVNVTSSDVRAALFKLERERRVERVVVDGVTRFKWCDGAAHK